ncbi:carbon-nitrogen hydrolase family protein [Saccharopolyspora mangrovi]|uniref:Carbon-nitrogen hydrolase family protein n=1 Tax=Saccharopolyspora mangrovi TaxID=3082379 RepID=A0ABU6AIS7_9PSEU|nr:carbon-nitrogen hydrolase family protein [Saccharopolyspora sp. S2-29]MEB3371372.1 carbon-nitrogen hydrolase family protein [Saccharopolyspora sp. S2-29]
MTQNPQNTFAAPAGTRRLKIAVVQPALRLAEQDWNLRRVESLVRDAVREHHPDVVVLPEAYNTPNVYHPVLRQTPVPIDGAPYQLLKKMAREHGCWVGGGYVSLRGTRPRGSYVIAEPDGTTYIHDKDEPSMWEYCYYTPGEDDGVFSTPFGSIGVAMGFETARTRTAQRMCDGGVQLILGGDCWPGPPGWPVLRRLWEREQEYYMLWAADTPSALARAVGAPAAVAFHVGPIDCKMPGLPGVPYPTIMTGESQIVSSDGHVLARMTYADGEGSVAATVDVGPPKPVNDIASSFWLRPNTFAIHAFWHYLKLHGRARFQYDLLMRRFPWQVREHSDLPGYNPGDSKTEPNAFGGPGPFDWRTAPKPARPLAHSLFHRSWANEGPCAPIRSTTPKEGITMTAINETKPAAAASVSETIKHNGSIYYPTERDVRRFAHIGKLVDRAVGTGSGPYYDSVVIVGAGFTASVMAARLARSEQFHGKVVLAGPRAEESRRLKDGATLRGHGTDYLCYALGVPQYAFVDALYGDITDGRGVGTRLLSAMTRKGPSGAFEFGRNLPVMGGHRGAPRPLFYGVRNSRAQAAIYELMDRSGVIEVPEAVKSRDEAFALAPGKRPLIVNAGHNSRLLRGEAPQVDWATVAVQAPLVVRPGGFRHIDTNAALFAGVRRGKKIDVGLFNPYGDPLSPRSTFYGIIVVEVSPGDDKHRELDIITDELYGIADALGMDVDDPDETLYSGFIPGSPWNAPQSAPGTLELQMIAHQGVSATYSDGMASGAAAAVAAAEAVMRGVNPDSAARRAVRKITRERRVWNIERNKLAMPVDLLLRTAAKPAAYYPHTTRGRTTWASAG